MKNKKKIVVIPLCLALASCNTIQTQADGNKDKVGAAIGATLCGLGALLAGAKGTHALLASAACGAIGWQIGKHLNEQDRLAMQAEAAKVLDTASDGEGSQWSNPETGASANIVVRDTRTETKPVEMLKIKQVQKPEKLELIGETYATSKRGVRVRSGPSTSTDIMGALKAGDTYTAVGKVVGKPWLMVAKNNITIGYVHEALIHPYSQSTQQSSIREEIDYAAIDLDAASIEANQTIDLDAVVMDDGEVIDLDNIEVVSESVVVETDCRTIDLDIESTQGNEKASQNACKSLDGAWVIAAN